MNRQTNEIRPTNKSSSRSLGLVEPYIGGKGQRKLSIILKLLQHLLQRSLVPLGDQMTEGKIAIRLTEIELFIILYTYTILTPSTCIARVR